MAHPRGALAAKPRPGAPCGPQGPRHRRGHRPHHRGLSPRHAWHRGRGRKARKSDGAGGRRRDRVRSGALRRTPHDRPGAAGAHGQRCERQEGARTIDKASAVAILQAWLDARANDDPHGAGTATSRVERGGSCRRTKVPSSGRSSRAGRGGIPRRTRQLARPARGSAASGASACVEGRAAMGARAAASSSCIAFVGGSSVWPRRTSSSFIRPRGPGFGQGRRARLRFATSPRPRSWRSWSAPASFVRRACSRSTHGSLVFGSRRAHTS